jgi:hypothetical protein
VELGHSVYDDGVNKAIQSPDGRWTKRCGASMCSWPVVFGLLWYTGLVFSIVTSCRMLILSKVSSSSNGICGGCLVVEFVQSTIVGMLILMKYMICVYTNYVVDM